LKRLQQTERVPAANEYRICSLNGWQRILGPVHRFESVTHRLKSRTCLGCVSVAIGQGEGDKQNRFGGTKKTFDLLLDVIEIAATIKGGIADE
jgi:hypothetical protein